MHVIYKHTGLIIGLIIFCSVGLIIFTQIQPGKLDAFAQCIAESEAQFYGAFWCQHCENQKALFGKSERLLPYIECSTPDGNNQLPRCTDAGISAYPTWRFSDGSEFIEVLSLEALSEKTGCQIPSPEA